MFSYTESLPDGWHYTQLGNKASIKARLGWKGLKADEYVDVGFIFLATPNLKGYQIDFNNVNYISERRYLESPEIMLQSGDVLLVKDGSTLGIVNIVRHLPAPTTVNSSIAVIRPKENLYGLYLYFYIQGQSFQDEIVRMKGGLGVPHLFQADLKDFSIPLPSLPEQQKIAEILDAIDKAIALTDTHITKLKKAKAGLLHDLLTRGIDEHGELRDYTRNPELFKRSALGIIPKDWDLYSLEDCVKPNALITYGIVQAGPHIANGVPYIRTGDMTGNHLKIENLLRTSPRIAALYGRSTVRTGELVCAIRATVGKVLEVPPELDGANLTQGTARISPREDVNTHFLLWSFMSELVKQQIISVVKGTTFAEITLQQLRKLKIIIPQDKIEQDKIAAILDTQEAHICKQEVRREKLKLLKKGLMSDLLTGRVRVKI